MLFYVKLERMTYIYYKNLKGAESRAVKWNT